MNQNTGNDNNSNNSRDKCQCSGQNRFRVRPNENVAHFRLFEMCTAENNNALMGDTISRARAERSEEKKSPRKS